MTKAPSARHRHLSLVAVAGAPHASTGRPNRIFAARNTRETNISWAHHDDPSLTLAPAPCTPRGTQDNPQFFVNPLQFEIQYECLQNLANGASPLARLAGAARR